jgi:hypothetical protein
MARGTKTTGDRRAVSADRDDRRDEIERLLVGVAHPLQTEIQDVRRVLLAADPSIHEGIKWNSVSFRNQNDFFATIHLRSTSTVQLILHAGVTKKATAETGVPVADPRGLIEKWLAKDRCLLTLGSGATFRENRPALAALVKAWIQFV